MKIMGSFEAYGFDELLDCISALENSLPNEMEQIVEQVANKAVSYARELAPVDTGRLRQSIMYRIDAIDDGLKLVVFANREYGIYVEYGTGTAGDPSVAHVNKSTWVYYDEERGFITAHAQPPRPFMYPAFVYTVDLIRGGEVQRLLSERLCELMGGDSND